MNFQLSERRQYKKPSGSVINNAAALNGLHVFINQWVSTHTRVHTHTLTQTHTPSLQLPPSGFRPFHQRVSHPSCYRTWPHPLSPLSCWQLALTGHSWWSSQSRPEAPSACTHTHCTDLKFYRNFARPPLVSVKSRLFSTSVCFSHQLKYRRHFSPIYILIFYSGMLVFLGYVWFDWLIYFEHEGE